MSLLTLVGPRPSRRSGARAVDGQCTAADRAAGGPIAG